MAGRFILPAAEPVLDANGKPQSGAVLTVYLNRTTTLASIYLDSGLTSPAANPQTSNAAGLFYAQADLLWADDTKKYTVKLQLPGGGATYTYDDVSPLTGSAGSVDGVYATHALAVAANVPTGWRTGGITLQGYYTAGDGGGGFYRYLASAPAHPAYFQSADGAYWELVAEPINVRQLGAKGDGATNDGPAIANALTAGAALGIAVSLGRGNFLSTQDISVPVGSACSDFSGNGRDASRITFSGGSIVNGLYLNGNSSTFPSAPAIRDMRIECASAAVRGVTLFGLNSPRLRRVTVNGAVGNGIYANYSKNARLDQCVVSACGTASLSPVEIDHATGFAWDQCAIPSANGGVLAGLLIDRTVGALVQGGQIIGAGVAIRVASKTEGTTACEQIVIRGLDMETPGDCYIDAGYGWTGTVGIGVLIMVVDAARGIPSGTAQISYGIKLKNVDGFEARNVRLTQAGTPLASFALEGTNFGTVVRVSKPMAGQAFAWVTVAGVQATDATPIADWLQDDARSINQGKVIAGTGPSSLLVAQGGICRLLEPTNGGAVNMATLTGGVAGVSVALLPQDGNTTLVHTTSTANGFLLKSGANTALASGSIYVFTHNGTLWVQQ